MRIISFIHTRNQLSFREKWTPAVAALLVAVALTTLTFYLNSVEVSHARLSVREGVATEAGLIRTRLESEVNSSAYLSLGLVSYIGANPSFKENEIAPIARRVLAYGKDVRNITIAPDNIVKYVYPLQGNEKALGLHYLDNLAQRDSVLTMMKNRNFVFTGPVDLVQGGKGFINRFPIYTKSDNDPLRTDRYWGLVSIVLNADSLLNASGINDTTSKIKYALRGKNGLGEKGELIYGSPDVFMQDPVIVDIVLPQSQSWQLAAIPNIGWPAMEIKKHNPWYSVIGLALSLVFAGLIYKWLNELREIKLRDAELRLAASVFDGSNEAIVITDTQDNIISVNFAFTRLTEFVSDDVVGKTAEEIILKQSTIEESQKIHEHLKTYGYWHGEVIGRRKDNSTYPKSLTVYSVLNEGGIASHYIYSFSDISAHKIAQDRIHHLAYHD